MTPSDRIVEAARAVCEQRGAHRLTMRRIAARAGVSAPAIYRHFDGKQALLERLVADANRAMSRYLERGGSGRTPWQRLRQTMDGLLDFALEDPTSYDVLFYSRERRDPELQPFAKRSPNFLLWLQRIEDCRKSGFFDSRFSGMEIAIALWSLLHGLFALHQQGRFGGSVSKLRELYRRSLEMALAGIREPGCSEGRRA